MRRRSVAGGLLVLALSAAPVRADEPVRFDGPVLKILDFHRPSEGDSPEECIEVRQPNPMATDAAMWAGFGTGVAKAYLMLFVAPLTVLVPHPGVSVRERGTELSLSWSGSVPFGSVTACRRKWGGVDDFYGHRLVLDSTWLPGRPRAFTGRAGYRIVHHPTGWPVGVGAGLAGALELAGPQAVRGGVSPELVVHLGRCCSEFYWLVSLRWDRYFTGVDRDHVNVSLGLVYW
jgi:hypothetical protein